MELTDSKVPCWPAESIRLDEAVMFLTSIVRW